MLVVAFSGCSNDAQTPVQANPAQTPQNVTLSVAQREHVRIDVVEPEPYRTTVSTIGAVDFDADRATGVTAAFSGPVDKVLVAVGDKVRKGDALAIVDSADFSAAIDTYAKALVNAQNLRKIADADQDLVLHKGVSERENAQAQTDAAGAEADRDAALAALVALGVDRRTLRDIQAGHAGMHVQGVIRAPVDGVVVEKLIAPGQLLQAGSTACFTIADLSQVWVLAQVADAQLPAVAVGDPADVRADDVAKALSGKVTSISPLIDPDTRATAVRVLVANPGGVLKKSMYVNVDIRSREQRDGLLVPDSAILRDDENLPFVYVVQRDGSFARKRVTLGDRVGDRYAIPQGVVAGDRVVTDGALFMQFMQSQ